MNENAKHTRLLAVRIHNSTRSCVLVKCCSNGVWTLPMVTIEPGVDPLFYINDVLKQIKRSEDFQVVSAVSIIDYSKTDTNGDWYDSIIYDIRYIGKVIPGVSPFGPSYREESRWVQKGMLEHLHPVSFPLNAYLTVAEKEECIQ